MGSYHSRQIADLVLLLCEFNFLKSHNTTFIQKNLIVFFRYIDDGLLIYPTTQINDIINKLCYGSRNDSKNNVRKKRSYTIKNAI